MRILIRALVLTAILITAYALTVAVMIVNPGLNPTAVSIGSIVLLLLGWYLIAHRKSGTEAQTRKPLIRRIGAFILIVVFAFAIVGLIPGSLLRAFTIPSGSMLPTIVVGDYILVFKRYSSPERGDIVAFSYPTEPDTARVARLVGMPGDRIQMINGLLHINDQPVKRARIEDFVDEDGKPIRQWSETLPNGVTHRTIDLIENGFYDNTQVYVVPEGHYFMMGDNRDNSSDSRVKSRTVPRENLIGRTFFCARGTCR